MEFTRTSGFNDDEILTLTNLPVRVVTPQDFGDQWDSDTNKANFPLTLATVNGVQVKVLPPVAGAERIATE